MKGRADVEGEVHGAATEDHSQTAALILHIDGQKCAPRHVWASQSLRLWPLIDPHVVIGWGGWQKAFLSDISGEQSHVLVAEEEKATEEVMMKLGRMGGRSRMVSGFFLNGRGE